MGTKKKAARFSTLQRVEIAEIDGGLHGDHVRQAVSVLFNESKLLKSSSQMTTDPRTPRFQYSSTSRNC